MQINPKSKFVAILLLLVASSSQAFPPAPYHKLYGVVRDQVDQTVTAEGAQVIHNRSGTTFYTDKAIAAQGLFSLVVSMNNEFFYPIEVSGNLTAGKGGERVWRDLTLGEESLSLFQGFFREARQRKRMDESQVSTNKNSCGHFKPSDAYFHLPTQ
jgi:hypothetical protein